MDVRYRTWFVAGGMCGRPGPRASGDTQLSRVVAVSCVTIQTWHRRGRIQRAQDLRQWQDGSDLCRGLLGQARGVQWVSTPLLHFSMLVDG
jgi:hypothetical protein